MFSFKRLFEVTPELSVIKHETVNGKECWCCKVINAADIFEAERFSVTYLSSRGVSAYAYFSEMTLGFYFFVWLTKKD